MAAVSDAGGTNGLADKAPEEQRVSAFWPDGRLESNLIRINAARSMGGDFASPCRTSLSTLRQTGGTADTARIPGRPRIDVMSNARIMRASRCS
jgi:hypothetical protein